jgi:flagellar hook-associated protein 2
MVTSADVLATLYGKSTVNSLTGNSALSPTVAARVRQALAGQQGNIDLLNNSLASAQIRLSGLGQLHSALATFEALAEGVAGGGLLTSAAVSNRTVLAAATSAASTPGTYDIEVSQLAQGQVLASATQLSANATLGSGASATVKLEWGMADTDGFNAAGTNAKTITIDSSNNTLDGIAAALKDAGVAATVVRTQGGYALQIDGEQGAAQTLSITVSGDAALRAAIGFDPDKPQAGGMVQQQAAQDAVLTVDGKRFTSSSNTVEDAVAGTTLTLANKGTTVLTVSQDGGQIAKNVASFIQGYNDLHTRLAALRQGALQDDPALAQITTQLSSMIRLGGTGTMSRGLADAGLSRDASGQLVLDETKLKAAIAVDAGAVSKLFTNAGKGLADKLDSKIDALTADSGVLGRTQTRASRELEVLTTRRATLAQSLTVQAQALAQLYTIQEQMGSGTGTLLDLLG